MRMATWVSLFFAVALADLIFFIGSATASESKTPELILRICRGTVVRNATSYVENYKMLVESMAYNMSHQGFAFSELGQPPDRLYVFSQCMGDLSSKECTKCFIDIRKILSGCFPATGGRIFYWGCYIRAENYSFFDHALEPDDFRLTKCGDTRGTTEFGSQGKEKIKQVQKIVKESGYGISYRKTSDLFFLTIGVCWKSLDKEKCGICVDNAAQRCNACLPYTECRLLNSGCALRYADYDFGNNPSDRINQEILYIYGCYIVGGLGVSVLIVAAGIYLGRASYKRKIQRRKTNGIKRVHINLNATHKGLNLLEFNHSTLEKATECFADSHRLGQGGYGEVFKGTLPDGREIAIKRLYAMNGKNQSEEICNEIDIISRAQHKNLVRFLGCCFTNTNSFLIYEFLVNKSLDRIIFDSEKKKELDWKKRWQIILGTAEGLEYLHKGCQLRIIHRDIKASNVLLDSKWRPKIADFGLARFSTCGQNISSATIAGTFGYLAPEYLAQGRLTEKVDVYSFGVLLLEIVSGVRNNKLWSESSFETLVSHVWKKFKSDTVSEIIEREIDVEEEEREVKRVVQVGLLCTQESPELRPNMTMVMEMLKQDYDTDLPMPTQPPFIDEHLEFSSSLGSFRWKPSLGLKL